MKKIVIMFAMLLVANSVFAFDTFTHQTVSAITEMYLTDKAKREVQDILQSTIYKECVWVNTLRKNPDYAHTKDWHFTVLNVEGKSVTTYENDGVVQLEKSIEVLRHRANYNEEDVKTALRKVIHLTQDLHCLSHIYIDGYDQTRGFTFRVWDELTSKRSASWNANWHRQWDGAWSSRYYIFTPTYYGEDIDIYARGMKEAYSKGTPREWVEEGGRDVLYALKDFYTGGNGDEVRIKVLLNYEYLHTKCLAKAGYRLAALLNDIFK